MASVTTKESCIGKAAKLKDESDTPEAPAKELQAPEVREAMDVGALATGTVIASPTWVIGGSSGGSVYEIRGWEQGKVVTKIRVYEGEYTIKAITLWLTDSNGTTYGNPAGNNYKEYAFGVGERITSMTLYGNGVGTRAGWLEFTTSLNSSFSYGMYGRKKQTPYHQEVGSGILVGAIFRAGQDIDAFGFRLLNHLDYSEMTNMKYPTLGFDTGGIVPTMLDSFKLDNDSSEPKNWEFKKTVSKETQSIWSTTTDVSIHATVSVQAGIPLIAEVNSEFGWQVGVSSHHETSEKRTVELSWNISGICQPGNQVNLQAITREGKLNLPYEATMVVKLKNGASFSYPLKGIYNGVAYTGAEVTDNSSR